eukprot:CAMPEP_0172188450 /NCGR_PEP_ID=MMETSP1050-20130122/21937_1 /TAXON_ID=233186 /ORGANISM="Cryptomonas curvata, Strain CCAP979/52" /LENGTH=84 /DNA_ID=CAMNT_0012862959 /DNA_START=275 /DNA_END=529 /DNA_ORIENTATION=-
MLGSQHELATEQSLYYWRPWAKDQDRGYIDGYMKVLWWDHSFSYDNSNFQNPLAEAKQEEPKNGYKYNYNFLYPAKKKDKVVNA